MQSETNSQFSDRKQAREGHTLGWLALACALITLIVCLFSWVATYGLLPERALASGESLLAADYQPWEGYRVLNLDVANLATAAAYGDAPWQGEGTPMVLATLAPGALTVPPGTAFAITSQVTPLPTLTLAPVQATPTRRPVLPRATNTLPPTIPAVTSTATVAPTAPPPAPTSPPPAPTSPPPAPTATNTNTPTPTATVNTPTPTDTPTATATPTDTPTATATNPPGDTTNPPNGTITARGENAASGEGMVQAFDNSTAKWLDFSPDPNRASWIQYMYQGSQTNTVTQYTITSANDHPERDPYNWRLFGIDDLGNEILLDTQTGQTFSARFMTITYTISNSTAYRGYKLVIDSVFNPATANSVQLAEIELLGY